MVSAPTFDPANPPVIEDGDERYDGVYLNRFLSGTFVPGSVFKTVTLEAAIENIPDLFDRTWTCTGSTLVGGRGGDSAPVPTAKWDIKGGAGKLLQRSLRPACGGAGAARLQSCAEQAGLTGRYTVSGISTAAGRWTSLGPRKPAGLGRRKYSDAVNPCALMVYMGPSEAAAGPPCPSWCSKPRPAWG